MRHCIFSLAAICKRGQVILWNAIIIIIIFISVSHLRFQSSAVYQYREHIRWSGIWRDPNVYGILLAEGITLSVGLVIHFYLLLDFGSQSVKQDNRQNWKIIVRILRLESYNLLRVAFLAVAIGAMATGLINSFCRGAWISVCFGISYLFWQGVQTSGIKDKGVLDCSLISLLKYNWLPLAISLLSVAMLLFWNFRQTDWRPAHRALSVIDTTDFSSRNRTAAWVGGLQIMTEHPCFGTGWNQSKPLYENYYLLPKLNESGAIQTNDYIILGDAFGIPAFFCFGTYLSLALIRGFEIKKWNAVILETNWLKTVCRAGVIVLLVGFWFDGGLFKLPVNVIFWILLGLISINWSSERLVDEIS